MGYSPDPTPIVTRLAQPSDFDRIAAGHAETYAEHAVRERDYEGEAAFIAPYLRASPRWRQILPQIWTPKNYLWVAERHGGLAGHLAACRTRAPGTWALQIADITVYEGHRAQRTGRALVQTAERTARAIGTPMLVALIWPGNAPSQAFFAALGFALAPQKLPDRDVTLIGAVKQVA